jgi:hypothetical protein
LYALRFIILKLLDAIRNVIFVRLANFLGKVGEAFLASDFQVDILSQVNFVNGGLFGFRAESRGGVDAELMNRILV